MPAHADTPGPIDRPDPCRMAICRASLSGVGPAGSLWGGGPQGAEAAKPETSTPAAARATGRDRPAAAADRPGRKRWFLQSPTAARRNSSTCGRTARSEIHCRAPAAPVPSRHAHFRPIRRAHCRRRVRFHFRSAGYRGGVRDCSLHRRRATACRNNAANRARRYRRQCPIIRNTATRPELHRWRGLFSRCSISSSPVHVAHLFHFAHHKNLAVATR